MPTYEYRCAHCDRTFDVVQSFHDDPLTECPTCGQPVKKVFGNVGIVFKGSGFYKNDSRSTEKRASGDGSDGSAATAAGASESPSGGQPKDPATPTSAPGPAKKADGPATVPTKREPALPKAPTPAASST